MAFTALTLAHAPDADHTKHRCKIETETYKLFTVAVKSQEEALKVARQMHEDEKIDAILLCPGFTHSDIAELFEALEGKVSVSVARGDGPSTGIAMDAMKRSGFKE
jgi:hypothetical protein